MKRFPLAFALLLSVCAQAQPKTKTAPRKKPVPTQKAAFVPPDMTTKVRILSAQSPFNRIAIGEYDDLRYFVTFSGKQKESDFGERWLRRLNPDVGVERLVDGFAEGIVHVRLENGLGVLMELHQRQQQHSWDVIYTESTAGAEPLLDPVKAAALLKRAYEKLEKAMGEIAQPG